MAIKNKLNAKKLVVFGILVMFFAMAILFTVPLAHTQTIGSNANSALIPYNQNGYDYVSANTSYTLYIKSHSNYGDGVKYSINDSGTIYSLIYQPQDYSFRDVYGSQDYIASINSVNGAVDGNKITFSNCFPYVNLEYKVYSNIMKENFIISQLPKVPASYLTNPVTLDFGGYIKYGALSIYVNNTAVSGNFVTNQKIEFRTASNKTAFYLPQPIARDAIGNQTVLQYEVQSKGNQIWFYVRTPYSWLSNPSRVYPVCIDPTVGSYPDAWQMPSYGSAYQFNYHFDVTADAGSAIAIILHDSGDSAIAGSNIEFPEYGSGEISGSLAISPEASLIKDAYYHFHIEPTASPLAVINTVYSLTISYTASYYITVTSAYGSPTSSGSVASGGSYPTSVTSPESHGTGHQMVCIGHSVDGGGNNAGTSHTFTNVVADHSITYNWQDQFYITINANGYGSPTQSSQWVNSGGSISVSVTSPESGGTGIQYLCTSETTQSINPVTSAQTITFNWQLQYYLTVTSTYGSPSGAGWKNAGTSANFGVTTPASGGAGIQYVFSSWSGSGSGSYSGGSSSSSVTMNNPITETASWTTQYYLTVDSDYGTPSGDGWFNSGSSAHAHLNTGTVSGGAGTQYTFDSWNTGGTNYAQSSSVTMSSAKTITASWSTEYYLTVTSSHGTTDGDGWYDSGATAYAGVSSGTVSGGTGIQYVFDYWGADASGSSYSQSNGITMNAAKTASASWTTQYYLTVSSTHGTPSGEGWKNAESTAYAGLNSGTVNGGTGTRYVFSSWSTGGTNYAQSTGITMSSAKTSTASWTTQYEITPSSDAHSSITPSSAVWVNSGSSQTFNYSANIGYSINFVTVDGGSVSITGNYTFSNAQTSHTIQVFASESSPPTYSSISASTTIAGALCQLNASFTDDIALHPNGRVQFGTNNSGPWVWDAAVNFTSTPQTFSVSKTLNSTVGKVVGCRWNFTDNAGNSNTTGIQTLTTTSGAPSPTPTPALQGEPEGSSSGNVPPHTVYILPRMNLDLNLVTAMIHQLFWATPIYQVTLINKGLEASDVQLSLTILTSDNKTVVFTNTETIFISGMDQKNFTFTLPLLPDGQYMVFAQTKSPVQVSAEKILVVETPLYGQQLFVVALIIVTVLIALVCIAKFSRRRS